MIRLFIFSITFHYFNVFITINFPLLINDKILHKQRRNNMNIKEKMYEKKNLNHVIHATFNPNGPGSIRLHLVPTKFSFFKSVPNIVVLNGRDYIPLNTAWSILLSIFIEEISKYEGLEIPDDTLKLIVNVTVERMRDIYGKRVGREDIKDDLWEMIDTFTAIAPGEDWAMAVRSSISCSSIHPSSSTNFFRISGTITNPPPKVQALN